MHPSADVCIFLWAQGDVEATIHVEKLGNQLVKAHAVDVLCKYSLGRIRGGIRLIQIFIARENEGSSLR